MYVKILLYFIHRSFLLQGAVSAQIQKVSTPLVESSQPAQAVSSDHSRYIRTSHSSGKAVSTGEVALIFLSVAI